MTSHQTLSIQKKKEKKGKTRLNQTLDKHCSRASRHEKSSSARLTMVYLITVPSSTLKGRGTNRAHSLGFAIVEGTLVMCDSPHHPSQSPPVSLHYTTDLYRCRVSNVHCSTTVMSVLHLMLSWTVICCTLDLNTFSTLL